MRVVIRKNPNGDTRTAKKDVTFKEFQKANDMHIEDVIEVMSILSDIIKRKGYNHDYTKKTHEKLFYENFLSTMNNNTDFVNDLWYQYHIRTERHHPLSNCHDDITLLDIIEMIVDCVCAGKARSGSVQKIEIDDIILRLAFINTIKLIDLITDIEEV